MHKTLKTVMKNIFGLFRLDEIMRGVEGIRYTLRVEKYNKHINGKLNFIGQGEGGLTIEGDLTMFSIHETSHLKSGSHIECNGGVTIGQYFHCGRALTILSTNHRYESAESIPYDSTYIKRPVIIEDFVWCGANVTIAPGVTVGEGAVVGCGAVVVKDVPPCAVVGGNPADIIKYRDKDAFMALKEIGSFY